MLHGFPDYDEFTLNIIFEISNVNSHYRIYDFQKISEIRMKGEFVKSGNNSP